MGGVKEYMPVTKLFLMKDKCVKEIMNGSLLLEEKKKKEKREKCLPLYGTSW